MAKLRVFISSTFYDLKHIRSSLENFVDILGYESILAENGNVAFSPDIPLDESCYGELKSCDIFVLIIGGRYGSAKSGQDVSILDDFYSRYESITKTEYENAVKRNIPVYILIEKSVYSEYETFRKNRDNKTVTYAHVDSINVFYFIEQILSQPKNNPVHHFEKHVDIEVWLKQQWAGLFQELIKRRRSESEIAELSKEVKELSNINTTLKRYLEEIVSTADNLKGEKIIKDEEARLSKSRKLNEFLDQFFVRHVLTVYKTTAERAIEIFTKCDTFEDFAKNYATLTGETDDGVRLANFWRRKDDIQSEINDARSTLGLKPLIWKNDPT